MQRSRPRPDSLRHHSSSPQDPRGDVRTHAVTSARPRLHTRSRGRPPTPVYLCPASSARPPSRPQRRAAARTSPSAAAKATSARTGSSCCTGTPTSAPTSLPAGISPHRGAAGAPQPRGPAALGAPQPPAGSRPSPS